MWIFIGRNVEARASQAGLHKPIKHTASAKAGKVSSLCRGGRRLKAVLLIRRKTWPRATEYCVGGPAGRLAGVGFLFLLSYSQKAKNVYNLLIAKS